MNRFTIKDIENLSGIKAHTLRIWEKRYGIINPKRKESRHRFYDNEDLKQVLRITQLYNNGFKISAIANMPQDEFFANEVKVSHSKGSIIKTLLEATLDLNESMFNDTFSNAVVSHGLEECMLRIVYPYLIKIGLLWMNNETLPAQERFASNIIIKKILLEINRLDAAYDERLPSVVLFTPTKEHHEIPLLFMYYLLKKNKYKVYYLGTNISLEVLDTFLEINKAGILYFHLITNFTAYKTESYVSRLCKQFPGQTIIMSGRQTQQISIKENNLRLLYSVEEMLAFCKTAFHPD